MWLNGSRSAVFTAGSGKTTFLLGLALRHALAGWQVFLMEPAHQAWKLRDAIGDDRACAYHDIATSPAINVLDPQFTNPLDQLDAVARKLETALGKPKVDAGRTRVQPYELDDDERGALDHALMDEHLYGRAGYKLPILTPDTVPTLSTLVDILPENPVA